MSSKVGSGGYGCVVRPVYPCHDVVLEEGQQYVGKYYTTEIRKSLITAEREFTRRVLETDPDGQYSIVPIGSCKVPMDEMDLIQPVCGKKTLRRRQFISKFGGTELTYASAFVKSFERVREVYINFINLFEGLALFNGADIYHYDIKQANIVMDDTFTCRFIDWGISEYDDLFWKRAYATDNYYPFDFVEATFAVKYYDTFDYTRYEDLISSVTTYAQRTEDRMKEKGIGKGKLAALANVLPTAEETTHACLANVMYVASHVRASKFEMPISELKRITKPDVYMLGFTLFRFSIDVIKSAQCTPRMVRFIQKFLNMVIKPMLSPYIKERSTPEQALSNMRTFINAWVTAS
jgi:hypothetical protein